MIAYINDESLKSLKSEISGKREQWREIREIRRNKKNELLAKGLIVKEIRKEKEYRRLKREQKCISKEIKHLEKMYNRRLSATDGR